MPTRPVSIGTVATPVVSYNNRRTSLSLANEDAATIYVSEDETVSTSNGYPILAGGALDLIRALGDEPQWQLFAISAGGGADLRVLEAFGSLPELFQPGGQERRGGGLAE